ncbi:hypothetical protein KKA00_09040 [bacterium]|nr:hypothetical protein [bacterium]
MIIGSITEIPYSSSYRAIQADKTAQTEETVPTEPLTETIAEDEKEKKNADKLRGENGVLRLLQGAAADPRRAGGVAERVDAGAGRYDVGGCHR